MRDSTSNHGKAQKIVGVLQAGYKRLQRAASLSSLLYFFLFLVVGWLLLAFAEARFFISGWGKSLSLFAILVLSGTAVFVLNRNRNRTGFREFYEQFFKKSGLKNELSAIDLHLDQSQSESRFYNAAIKRNLEAADPDGLQKRLQEHVNGLPQYARFRLGSLLLSAAFIILVVFSYFNPSESIRTLHFWQGYSQPNPYTFVVAPGDTTIEHGTPASISVNFSTDAIPENVVLQFKTDVEENFRERRMGTISDGLFESQELEPTSDLTYRVSMDGFFSDEYRMDVQLQPGLEELTATVSPPAYTQLRASEYRYPFPEISLYPGSELSIRAVANKPVQSIRLTGNNTERSLTPTDSAGLSFSYQFNPENSDTLRFEMTDFEGLKNRNPYRIPVVMQSDQSPIVVIQQPADTVMQVQPDSIAILYRATDDFGLTRTSLQWSHMRAFTDEPETGSVELNVPSNGSLTRFFWELSSFELRPRDRLTFHIRAWDNDAVNGVKASRSRDIVIRIPSLTEYFEELDEEESEVGSELEEVSDQFEQMEQEYDEFLQQLRENPEGSAEEQQMLQEIQDQQSDIDDAVKELNRRFRELQQEINQGGQVSEETRRAYSEMQQLMEELDDPALREAMERLQEAFESLSPEQLEEALENVEFNEELYRERIQRTVELFKRLKMNSDMDKLSRQFQDMAERVKPQEERSLDQLSEELESVEQDLQDASQQVDSLGQDPPESAREQLQRLKENSKREIQSVEERLDTVQEDAEESRMNGEQSPNSEMQQQQEQISEQLQNEAQRFQSSVSQMNGEQLQVNILAMQQALYRLLELSNMQETLAQSSSDTRSRSQGYIELARSQQNVQEQFSKVADTLFSISSEIPGIPNRLNEKKSEVERSLGNSLEEMVERNQRGATITSRESLAGINDLSSMVASLVDQLMNQMNSSGFGSGMSMQQMVEQLQNMSGNQQQLNQQLQEMVNDMQGDRLTREQSERLDQLARQQNRIRRQLQELQRSGALQQGDRILSELQRMMDDMEDSINDMRGGVTDPLMMNRQQNILSRMLSAEQAMQQRGEQEEREGIDATEFEQILPPDITLEELQQEIRARMQDPNFTRFSEKYQRLIELYFQRLRRMESETLP